MNIEVFQPQWLVNLSTGLCSGEKCDGDGRIFDEPPSPPIRTFTEQQAGSICNIYLNGYLSKQQLLPSQTNSNYYSMINTLHKLCIFDVINTGIPS
ncbi:unnamed protein product, partial [Rotaria sp. Silwood2]